MAIATETVTYTSDGNNVPAYVARPEGAGPFPAIVMCYELWGMAETPEGAGHMRDVAARFANRGYVAIVPDVFTARNLFPRIENGAVVGAPSDEAFEHDYIASVDWLRNQSYVNDAAIGTIGWCGGGRQAYFLAARCPGLGAAAAFYGRPVNRALTDHQPASPIDLVPDMGCPIFGAYGDADPGIPVDLVKQLETALEKHGKQHEIHVYAGAPHGFMNDQRESYRGLAASDAWRRVTRFFDQHLGGG